MLHLEILTSILLVSRSWLSLKVFLWMWLFYCNLFPNPPKNIKLCCINCHYALWNSEVWPMYFQIFGGCFFLQLAILSSYRLSFQTVSKIFTGIMDWNFPAFTLKINRCYDSNHAQGYSDLRSDYCYESEVSSSAISNASFSFMKKMLFMKMLESNGPDIEPYG